MSLLIVLTLIYVAVLILALAGGLIAIVYYLGGANRDLAKIAGGLQQVNKQVRPLQEVLTSINEDLIAVEQGFGEVDQRLLALDSEAGGPEQAAG